MKWKYETNGQYYGRMTKWHKWFSWYPVSYNGTTYWMQNVNRRMNVTCLGYEWEYLDISIGVDV